MHFTPMRAVRARRWLLCLVTAIAAWAFLPAGVLAAGKAGAPEAPTAAQAPPAPAAPPTPVQEAFNQGTAHYTKGEYDEAIKAFEAGYKLEPDPIFLFNIAQAYRLSGHPQEAVAAYRKYLAQVPDARNRAEVEGRIRELSPPAPGPAAEAPPPPEAPKSPQSPPSGDDQRREEASERAFALAKEGRQLIKAKSLDAGLAKLREAVTVGDGAQLKDGDRSDLHYALGLGLMKARQTEAGVKELQSAAALAPKDAEVHLDLATALSRIDEHDAAIRTAREALALGLSAEDKKDAEELIRSQRSERLHERLAVDASVSFGYDSNVLQGSAIQTIAGKSTGGATKSQAGRQSAALAKYYQRACAANPTSPLCRCLMTPNAPTCQAVVYDQAVISNYTGGSPQEEWDLPITANLDLEGRPYGNRKFELWLGYRFSQIAMTRYSSDPSQVDHDAYNFQEHDAVARLQATPWKWLQLKLRAEGFVNFSGLRLFTPFQGGLNANLDATFIESPRFRTLLSYKHNFRRSFDQANDGYLNGNKDDLGLLQELRLKWLRARLGYKFHSDLTGVLQTEVPYAVSAPAGATVTVNQPGNPAIKASPPSPMAAAIAQAQCPQTYFDPSTMGATKQVDVGCYLYSAPLSYQGHEAALSLRFLLPLGIDISSSFHYEYRGYQGAYSATYSFIPTTVGASGTTPEAIYREIKPALPSMERRDSVISADIAVTKDLPRGFSLELSYAFVDNLSTINNGVDNRNYTKHTAILTGYYSF